MAGVGFSTLGVGAMFQFDPTPGIKGIHRAGIALIHLQSKVNTVGSWISREADRLAKKKERESSGSGMFGGMGKMLGIGAAITGVGFLTKAMFGASSEFEDMQTELGTTFNVLAGGGSMREGLALAKSEMKEIEKMAIKAPGGAQDLLQIYKQIAGPLSVTGRGLKDVKDLTFAASIAAKGMGFDFKNMGFGLSKMIAGSSEAGDDLFKVFSKSLGLIKMTAAEWNELPAEQRFKQLSEALAKYGEAGDAVGATWTATASTMADLGKVAGRAFIDNLFNETKKGAGTVNNWFIANQDKITTTLGNMGHAVADFIGEGIEIAKGFFEGFVRWAPDIMRNLSSIWDKLSDSIGFLVEAIFGMFESGEGKAVGFGERMGAVAAAITHVFDGVATVIQFVSFTIGHIPYVFQVVGQRIGETIGLLVTAISNTFKAVYNILTEPFRKSMDFIFNIIDTIASTSIGAKAFSAAGFSVEDVKKMTNEGRRTTSDAQYESLDGYGDLPESPGARYLREQDKKKAEAAQKANKVDVGVTVEDHSVIENRIKMNVDGKQLSAAQARQQLEVTERAGAQSSSWQRRQLVTRSVTTGGGGR